MELSNPKDEIFEIGSIYSTVNSNSAPRWR